MIFANLNSYKQVAINVVNDERFFMIRETLPFIRTIGFGQDVGEAKEPFVPTFWCFDAEKYQVLSNYSSDDTRYFFGLVKELSQSPLNLFEPVDTFNYTKFTNTILNDVLKTEGKISIPILFPFTKGENHSMFMEAVYRISAFTFVPFFIYTDVVPNNIGGPLFLKNFNISVKGESDVSCSLDFIGGALPPESLSAASYVPEDVMDQGYPTLRQNDHTYRTSRVYDCALVITPDIQSALGAGSTNFYGSNSPIISWMSQQDFQIIEMSLNIEQIIDLKYTANDGTFKKVLDGPAYISMKERKASGTIVFISARDLSTIYNTTLQDLFSQSSPYTLVNVTSMLMYFGGPFYYPMKNVIFQQFKVDIQPDQATYMHTISFIALLQPTNIQIYYKQNIFDLDFDQIFLSDIDGTLKTEKQAAPE
jgi:hypothetical protein